METPLSTRRVTRSQTLASAINSSNVLTSRKVEESERGVTNSRQMSGKKQQQDRSALIDITNDSPIVGLAMGNLETPSSAMSKKRIGSQGHYTRTPGSGEALLRGQVKTLLQKVEEEAELLKITIENRPFFNLQGPVNSPIISLVAPTPANTPQVLNFSTSTNGLPSVTPSPVDEKFLIPQMMSEMFDGKIQEGIESENLITRSLLLDFSEKSESSDSYGCSSVMTYGGQHCGVTESIIEKLATDDDDSSIWSIQVNVSSTRDDDEDEEGEGEDCLEEGCEDVYDYEEEEEDEEQDYGNDDGLLDELCQEISKVSVSGMAKFTGKHIRFVYNSDDEFDGEEQVSGDEPKSPASGCVELHLKGLPTPKGKHLRFPQD